MAWNGTGVKVFGALGVGGLKMKIHKACIARLFERNDLVLDVETIADVAPRTTRGTEDTVKRPSDVLSGPCA